MEPDTINPPNAVRATVEALVNEAVRTIYGRARCVRVGWTTDATCARTYHAWIVESESNAVVASTPEGKGPTATRALRDLRDQIAGSDLAELRWHVTRVTGADPLLWQADDDPEPQARGLLFGVPACRRVQIDRALRVLRPYADDAARAPAAVAALDATLRAQGAILA